MRVDLNGDMGESFGSWSMGDDAALLQHVSSANIACGFHAGDPSHMRATARAAVEAGVAVGAHVAYRDLAGFGRRFMDVSPRELADDVLYQIGALDAMVRAAGGKLTYVKPHGALYNTIAHHEQQARAVIDGVRAFSADVAVLLLPGSVALDVAEQKGVRGVGEAFADRGYTPEGRLVSRREPGAVIHDAQAVVERVVDWARTGEFTAVDGSRVQVAAESLCLHGDTPGAVEIAAKVRAGLTEAGVKIEAFA